MTCAPDACRVCALKHAAVAEGLWLSLFALLPFGAAKAADAYMDLGVALPSATMAVLRFARAMHPADNSIAYLIMLVCVAAISGSLIVAAIVGSPEVKRAARFAAIVLMVAGILAWIAVVAVLLLPTIRA